MSGPPDGMMAAPNSAEITADVLSVQVAPDAPGRWDLELQILASETLEGGTFAREGTRVEGFTFESVSRLTPGARIVAVAQYLGGAREGRFQLERVRVLDQG